MNLEQFNKLTGLLGQIIERLPEPAAKPVPAAVKMPGAAVEGQSYALAVFLNVLDSWIQGAKENHDAMGHRNENRGAECWRQFTPSDIRRMVNDAARELGVQEFRILTGVAEDAG